MNVAPKRARVTHGLTRLNVRSGPVWKAYKAWQQMKHRCYNQSNKKWFLYGGAGVKVCDRWLKGEAPRSGFECFLADMGAPMMHQSIDRFPNDDGNYEPGNCRWATDEQQNANRGAYNVPVEWEGVRYCLSALAKKYGLSHQTLAARLKSGWSMRDALFVVPDKRNRKSS